MTLARCAIFSLALLALAPISAKAQEQGSISVNPRLYHLKGDFLASRAHNRIWGNGLYSRPSSSARDVIFVPTAYYRTKDYQIAFAYRPVYYHRSTNWRGDEEATDSKPYRLSAPAISNDQIAYYRSYSALKPAKE